MTPSKLESYSHILFSLLFSSDWGISIILFIYLVRCNVGIPVPREPFSFGGLYGTLSKFGDMDITGDGGMEFFSNRIKITTRWPAIHRPSEGGTQPPVTSSKKDHASFAGQM